MYDNNYLKRNYKFKHTQNLSKFSFIDIEIKNTLASHKKASINICEIGCGDGRQLISAAKAYPSINFTGIDLLVNPHKSGNLSLIKGDLLEELDKVFRDRSLHLIYGIDVIEHLSHKKLYELAILLREKIVQGGTFLARVPNLDSRAGQTNQFGDLTHQTAFNQHSARQFMDIFGLRDQEILADAKLVKIFNKYNIPKLTYVATKLLIKYAPNIYLKGIAA